MALTAIITIGLSSFEFNNSNFSPAYFGVTGDCKCQTIPYNNQSHIPNVENVLDQSGEPILHNGIYVCSKCDDIMFP